MLTVLLSFVGEQDPYSDKTQKEGSIVSLVRYITPDVVYLLPTAEGFSVKSETQTNAELTKEWLKEVNSSVKVFVKPLALPDPTDYSVIIPQARKAAADILSQLPDSEIHLNCSSGTPQLKSIWLILANAGVFPHCRLWQVKDPRFCGAERIRELEITFMEEENILNRIQRYAESMMFQQLSDECLKLKSISLYSYRKDKAALLARLFHAYHNWDLIHYREAYTELAGVLKDIRTAKDLNDLCQILMRQVEVLEVLKENDSRENRENVADLYFSACRRFVRHDYTDTLARFWRVYEGILYKHLRKKYGLEPTDLQKSLNQENVNKVRIYTRNTSKSLSIQLANSVLKDVFQDPTYHKMLNTVVPDRFSRGEAKTKLGSILDLLREKRNLSIVAHGMKPVSEEDAAACLQAMEKLFGLFFGNEQYLYQYPFQEKDIRTALQVLNRAFAQ